LEDHGLGLAREREVDVQLYATFDFLNAAGYFARFGFNAARAFSQCLQHLFGLRFGFENVAVSRGAVGVIHDGTHINTTAGGGFFCAAFVDGMQRLGGFGGHGYVRHNFLPGTNGNVHRLAFKRI
jgi:hypothetical protein